MTYCVDCGKEIEKVEYTCDECGEPMCESCYNYDDGVCEDCSEEYDDTLPCGCCSCCGCSCGDDEDYEDEE